jgi:hypothetical protein
MAPKANRTQLLTVCVQGLVGRLFDRGRRSTGMARALQI